MAASVSDLLEQIESLKIKVSTQDDEIKSLKARLAVYEPDVSPVTQPAKLPSLLATNTLTNTDILRYSRQMILPEWRPTAQKLLASKSVLVVGCGGLGCPAGLYLASAGVGRLGLVDHDVVELSNLQRQVGHSMARLGVGKAVSLATSLTALNSNIEIIPYQLVMDSSTALDIIKDYDIVLDCTDNVATRYLLNDACVLLDKPLVSGSALRWEGQLTVYNYAGGPTYRCLYPTPPPPAAVTNCSDGGVMGAVVGVIGCLQALECTKILGGKGTGFSGSMLLFDGLEGRLRTVKLRGRREGGESEVTSLIDYIQFCGAAPTDKESSVELLSEKDRITAKELSKVKGKGECVVVDVRTGPEVEMCCFEDSINLPLVDLQYEGTRDELGDQLMKKVVENNSKEVVVLCRRGNDSQVAVEIVREMVPGVRVRDVVGGLHSWTRDVDGSFPVY